MFGLVEQYCLNITCTAKLWRLFLGVGADNGSDFLLYLLSTVAMYQRAGVYEDIMHSCRGLPMGREDGCNLWLYLSFYTLFFVVQAGLSHNSLSGECLYVSSVNSQWKIGGFEAASQHKRIDPKVRGACGHNRMFQQTTRECFQPM